ncbi:MAG: hypothetical protein IJB91_04365 [Oscillospiraceae bacterium]|nr:hypothetical protein [Oscillospiraceae bacterium]
MKKVLAVLLLAVLLVSLCACTPKEPVNATTGSTPAAACEHTYKEEVTKVETCQEEGEKTFTCTKCNDTYTEAIKTQAHIYLDADCTTAKTCVNCGETHGRAKGHDYIQGVCTRCKEDQPGYKAFGTSTWQTMGVTFAENELDVIELRISEEGAEFRADFWGLLSELPESKQEEYLKNPDSLIEYKRDKYYYLGFGESCSLTYEEEDNTVTIQVVNGKNVGYLVLERKSVDKYTIMEVTGILFDDIITSCIKVNGVFQAVE